MRKGFFLLLTHVIFSTLTLAQDLSSFQERIEDLSDSTGMFALYTEVKNSGISSEDKITLGQLLVSNAQEFNYPKVHGLSLDMIGLEYRNQGDVDRAFDILNQAYDVAVNAKDINTAAWVDFDIAVTHYMKGEFDKSMEVIERDLEAIKDVNPGQYNTMLRAAGEILRGANRLERAADYLLKATEHSRETDRQDALAFNLNRLGVIYYQNSEHDLAKAALEESLSLAREINLDRAITMNLNDMGELYFALKDYERCIELYEIALGREMVVGDRANTYNNVARLYWQLERYDEAIDYALKALDLGTNSQSLPYVVDAQKILADSYMGRGSYRQSSEYYQAYILSKDSLFKLETQRQLADAETRYETAKKEQEIASLTEKEALERSGKKVYRNGLITAAILLMIVLILIWQVSKTKKRIEAQNVQLGELNATKDKFFSIIAHDLRSPMIALQGVGRKLDFFLRKGKEDKLLEMGGKIDESIDRLNHLLNNLLNWASTESGGMPYNPESLNTQELVSSIVELYSNLADSKNVKLELDLEDAAVFGDRNMLSTIIRNLLSNAIKFTEDSGTVKVTVVGSQAFTTVTVQDNGVGMDEEKANDLMNKNLSNMGTQGEQGFGLGLKLCKDFIERNNGSLQIESETGVGSLFRLQLPNKPAPIQRLNVA